MRTYLCRIGRASLCVQQEFQFLIVPVPYTVYKYVYVMLARGQVLPQYMKFSHLMFEGKYI